MKENQPKARVLAYYLPQFHPIPENDVWWGKGFTEWTNVGKAKPLFPGHYQPHVPADLGYYDLRVPETREAQAELARKYGVEGFVYWHYWFGNGKRLLERPFNEVLASGKPDFPFALAWANETWKGFDYGSNDERNALIEQMYPGDDDYIAHFNELLPAFKDNRYITCDDKPIFVIYNTDTIPDISHYIRLWNELAKKNGLKGIYFIAHRQSLYTHEQVEDYLARMRKSGFDAINVVNRFKTGVQQLSIPFRIVRKIFHKWLKMWPEIYPYNIDIMRTELDYREDVFPAITPNWDHTPRSGWRGVVLKGATPDKFGEAMRNAVNDVSAKPFDKRLIFIKSWNEWAEGNYLEPDLKYGHQYLEALKQAVY